MESRTGLSETLLSHIRALARNYGAQRVALFGSRARGDHRPRSDVDLAVWGLDQGAFNRFAAALEECDTLLSFDVVRVDGALDTALLSNIEREGISLMEGEGKKLAHLIQAIRRIKEGIVQYNDAPNQLSRDGVIQRFEFTAELAWKSCREYLLSQGYTQLNSPMSVMRIAYAASLVDDEQGWVDLLRARNITSHIYSDEQAETVFQDIVSRFVPLMEQLRDRLTAAPD